MPSRNPTGLWKPSGPVQIHPALRNACKAIYPLADRWQRGTDALGTAHAAFGATTASPAWGARKGGNCLVFDGGDTCLATITGYNAYPLLIMCSFTVNNLAAANHAFVLGEATDSAFFSINSSGSNVNLTFRKTTAGVAATVSGPTVANQAVYHCAGLTRSNTDHSLFVNGRKFTSATDVGAGAFTDLVNLSIGAIKRATVALNLTGGVYWAGAGNFDPGDEFLLELTENPWRFLYAPEQDIFFDTVAGGTTDGAIDADGTGLAAFNASSISSAAASMAGTGVATFNGSSEASGAIDADAAGVAQFASETIGASAAEMSAIATGLAQFNGASSVTAAMDADATGNAQFVGADANVVTEVDHGGRLPVSRRARHRRERDEKDMRAIAKLAQSLHLGPGEHNIDLRTLH